MFLVDEGRQRTRLEHDFGRTGTLPEHRVGRIVLAIQQRLAARVQQHAQARMQHRVVPAEAHPVGQVAFEHRVAAGHAVGDAHHVVHAHVVEHDQRGHRTVGEVLFEAALAPRQRNAVGHQPIHPRAIAPQLDRVDRQLLEL